MFYTRQIIFWKGAAAGEQPLKSAFAARKSVPIAASALRSLLQAFARSAKTQLHLIRPTLHAGGILRQVGKDQPCRLDGAGESDMQLYAEY